MVLRKKSIFAAVMVVVLLLVLSPLAEAAAADDLTAVKKYLNNNSFYQLDPSVYQLTTVEAVIEELQKVDKWADYYTAEQYESVFSFHQGEYVGIGVELVEKDGHVIINQIFDGSPAEAAGFMVGDIIVSIDGTDVTAAALDEVDALIDGEYNSIMIIKLQRDGVVREYIMNRRMVDIPTVEYYLQEDTLGYIAISRFSEHTADQVAAALSFFTEREISGLIVDLRDCPGGSMKTATETIGLLVANGPVTYVVDRHGYSSFYAASEEIEPIDVPLAVLVNDSTASAAEMLAAVVQDTHRGTVIGMNTYGKGLIQSMIKLPSGGGLYFTTGKYITRGFQDINSVGGVTPDILESSVSQQMAKAVAWLSEQETTAKTIMFAVGSKNMVVDGVSRGMPVAALLESDVAYVPLRTVLESFGWDFYYSAGKWYGFDGSRRLVIDTTVRKVYYAGDRTDVIILNGTTYLPLSFCRKFGYQVTWQAENRQITVIK